MANVARSFLVAGVLGGMLLTSVANGMDSTAEAASVSVAQLDQEVEGWRYVSDVFAKEMNVSRGVWQKIGSFVGNDLDWTLMPVSGVAGMFVGGFVTKMLFGVKIPMKSVTGTDIHMVFVKNNIEIHPKSNYLGFFVSLGLIVCSGVLFSLLSKLICTKLGNLIENRSGQCSQVLTSFVQNWDQHKEQTPKVLHAFFEKLQKDVEETGSITVFTAQQSKKFVEYLVTASIVSDALQQVQA